MKVYVRAPYPEKNLNELKTMFDEVVYEPWTETGERCYFTAATRCGAATDIIFKYMEDKKSWLY